MRTLTQPITPGISPSQGIASIIEIDVLSLAPATYDALKGVFERFPAVMTVQSFKRRTGLLRRSSPRFIDFEKIDLRGANYIALIEKPENALPNKCAVLLRNNDAWDAIKSGAEVAISGGQLKSVQRTKLESALSSAVLFSEL